MIQRFFGYLLRNQVLFALFIIAIGWILVQIRDILITAFLSYIIMSAIRPSVLYLQKKRFPRVLAVIIPFSGMLLAIFLLIIPLVPFVITQIQSLVTGFPHYLKEAAKTLGVAINTAQVQAYLTNELDTLSKNAFTVTTKVFGGIFSLMAIFIVSFYLLFYYGEFKRLFARLFRPDTRSLVLSTLDTINEKLGAWLRGQIVLMFFIGLMSWVALTILGVPYALPLALLSAILEIVPTLGPILSSIPAVIVALTVSPTLAITVILTFIVIQMIENNFLVPKVMQKAVGLNPVVIILGVMIGANLMGIAGALLAIPFISFIVVILKSLEQNS